MAEQQYTQLVHAADDLVGHDALPLPQLETAHPALVHGGDRGVGGQVRVVHGGTVDGGAVPPDGQVVADREGLTVPDQQAEDRAG